jgi:hypothetical protein
LNHDLWLWCRFVLNSELLCGLVLAESSVNSGLDLDQLLLLVESCDHVGDFDV